MINYLLTSPKPSLQKTDAVYNEVKSVRDTLGGYVTSLYPFKQPSSKYPPFLYGFHNLKSIRSLEKKTQINHIFSPSLLHIPSLLYLRNPIVYTVVASMNSNFKLPSKRLLSKVKTFVVSNQRDKLLLENRGVNNVKLIETGINTSSFEKNPIKLEKTLHLLMASAPWELKQFHTKGIHLILEALQKTKNIHFTFLWRNLLTGHMKTLIRQYKVEKKVTLIDDFVDINKHLSKIHATVLLSNDPRVVKSIPHSLIESLLCGKPVITTNEIPMSDFIKINNYGIVLQRFSVEDLIEKIGYLKNNIEKITANTMQINTDIFCINRMIKDYKDLYSEYVAKVNEPDYLGDVKYVKG